MEKLLIGNGALEEAIFRNGWSTINSNCSRHRKYILGVYDRYWDKIKCIFLMSIIWKYILLQNIDNRITKWKTATHIKHTL